MPEGPHFTHDRECCSFLGHEGGFDIYSCPTKTRPTIIARFGNEGSEYCSGATFFVDPDFSVDWVRAGLTVIARRYVQSLDT